MNTETNNPSSGYELTKEVASLFESLKHVNEDGVEYGRLGSSILTWVMPDGSASKR